MDIRYADFIYKDSRDIIISYLSTVMNDGNHIHHHYFTQHIQSTDERLLKLIGGFSETKQVARKYGLDEIGYGVMNQQFNRYLRWMDDPNTCVVRYEELVSDQSKLQNEMERIVDYLWIRLATLRGLEDGLFTANLQESDVEQIY